VLLVLLAQPLARVAATSLKVNEVRLDRGELRPAVTPRGMPAQRIGLGGREVDRHTRTIGGRERLSSAAAWPGGRTTRRSLRGGQRGVALSELKRIE